MNSTELNILLERIYDLANQDTHDGPIALGQDEDVNRIIVALNYLEEKLKEEKRVTKDINNMRLQNMQEVLNCYLSRDFTPKAKLSGTRDEIDALALSVNYFGEEMMESFDQINKQQKILEDFNLSLEEKVKKRTRDLELAQYELQQTLQKEKELNDLKSRFVATASHQFRTPLTIIQSSLAYLKMQQDKLTDDFKPVFSKSHLRISRQIENMTLLMNEVLILEKINIGKKPPKTETVSLLELCKEVTGNYNQIQPDGREMLLTVNGLSRTIEVDPEQIEHALSNLISNAFKYSLGKRSPELTIDFNPKSIQVTVKDYGLGIPSDEMEHLFEPFYRASNVHEVSGSGLGTAIAKEYIEMNNGSVSVSSKQNKGTEFVITFIG